jgi:hypothetical protein
MWISVNPDQTLEVLAEAGYYNAPILYHKAIEFLSVTIGTRDDWEPNSFI